MARNHDVHRANAKFSGGHAFPGMRRGRPGVMAGSLSDCRSRGDHKIRTMTLQQRSVIPHGLGALSGAAGPSRFCCAREEALDSDPLRVGGIKIGFQKRLCFHQRFWKLNLIKLTFTFQLIGPFEDGSKPWHSLVAISPSRETRFHNCQAYGI